MTELTISELQAGMQTGEMTARSVTEMYLRRIAEIDQAGPTLNSVIEINPDALDIADALDAERRERGPRGPLHGIPILIKDNIDTADRMHDDRRLAGAARPSCRAGRHGGSASCARPARSSWARPTSASGPTSARPIRSAGGAAAAAKRATRTRSTATRADRVRARGWRWRRTCARRPWAPRPTARSSARRTPTASWASSRRWAWSAAPASSRSPTARTPPARWRAPWRTRRSCWMRWRSRGSGERGSGERGRLRPLLDRAGLRGARIGVARNFCGFNPRVDAVFEASLAALRDAGAVIIDPANIETAKQIDEPEYEVLLYEFKADLNAYLAGLGPAAPVHSLAGVIAFNEANRDRVMPYFGQELMLMAQDARPADRREVPAGAGGLPPAGAGRGDRCDAGEAPARRHRRALRRTGMAHRLCQRRPLRRRQLDPGGGRRLPQHHRAGGLRLRAAGRDLVHRPGVARAGADPVRVRVRADDTGEEAAAVHGEREPGTLTVRKRFTLSRSSGMIILAP